MPSLLFSRIILVFSVYSVLSVIMISNADNVPNPYELVEYVCRKLGYDNFCLEVLKSDTRSMYAKEVTTLATIAVDVATKNSTYTRDYFLGVTTAPPAVLQSLKDCINPYNIVVSTFEKCLNEDDCSLIGYDIHVAGDEVRRCQMIADSNGAHDSFITTSNNVTEYLCGLCESLANLMCEERRA